jgi:small-conductance mechanosensitive channel
VLMQAAHQNVEELEFFIDKLKDDLEEMTKNLLFNGRQNETEIKKSTKTCEEDFKKGLKEEEGKYSGELQHVRTQLELNERTTENERAREEEQYQKKLLELYKESDRLKKILKTQDERLTEEKTGFRRQFESALQAYNREKDEELVKL